MARTTIRSRAALKNFSLLPLAIPGIIIAFGYLGAFSGTPLDSAGNPLPLLALAYTIRRLPMMVSSCLAGFEQVSGAFEEAARSVGASPGTILRFITAPLLREFILAGAVLCFSFAMVEVSDSIILAREERYYPIAKALYALTARPDGIEIASALGVVVMLVSTALLWVATRMQRSRKEVA
jgi:iron(III) transport system permease protein